MDEQIGKAPNSNIDTGTFEIRIFELFVGHSTYGKLSYFPFPCIPTFSALTRTVVLRTHVVDGAKSENVALKSRKEVPPS